MPDNLRFFSSGGRLVCESFSGSEETNLGPCERQSGANSSLSQKMHPKPSMLDSAACTIWPEGEPRLPPTRVGRKCNLPNDRAGFFDKLLCLFGSLPDFQADGLQPHHE
jgi:hypothetical protein